MITELQKVDLFLNEFGDPSNCAKKALPYSKKEDRIETSDSII